MNHKVVSCITTEGLVVSCITPEGSVRLSLTDEDMTDWQKKRDQEALAIARAETERQRLEKLDACLEAWAQIITERPLLASNPVMRP
ncbi:MAG: hypothetical protein IPK48_07875 [Gammaproteobacteria bacterium]|nr:hypothetical protein [Gammaproteobacteria bacterium]